MKINYKEPKIADKFVAEPQVRLLRRSRERYNDETVYPMVTCGIFTMRESLFFGRNDKQENTVYWGLEYDLERDEFYAVGHYYAQNNGRSVPGYAKNMEGNEGLVYDSIAEGHLDPVCKKQVLELMINELKNKKFQVNVDHVDADKCPLYKIDGKAVEQIVEKINDLVQGKRFAVPQEPQPVDATRVEDGGQYGE